MDFFSATTLMKLKVLSKPGLAFAGLAVVALLVVLEWRAVQRPRVRKAVTALLTLLGIIATASYLEFGQFRYGRYINPHDVFHYYMGSKYSREIGYSHLYASALVADAQMNGLFDLKSSIRSQQDYGYVPASTVLKDAAKYEALFSPARWREFKSDIAFFQSRMPKAKWNAVLRDKGYNATPVWNMLARALSNTFDTRTGTGVNVLLMLDLGLVAAMLLMVYRAFGWNMAMLAAVFFASNFFNSYVHIRGAFLRLDWVAMTVIAICSLKLNRYKTAGAAMAYAALARVFPVIFTFGVGACFLWDLIRTRKISRRYVEFFAAFLLAVAVLVGLSILDDGDLHLWREFADKISLHNNDLSTTRVGFKYLFLHTTHIQGTWPEFVAARQQEFAARHLQWWAIQALVLLACFVAAQRLRDHEALALGFVPVFFLVAPTFYYHVMLIIPFMFFISRPQSLMRLAGAGAMFALSGAAFYLNTKYPLALYLSYLLSWMLLALAGLQVAVAVLARTEEDSFAPATRRVRIPLCLIASALALFAAYTLVRPTPGKALARSALADRLKPDAGVVQLALVGDVMMARGVQKTLTASGQDFAAPMANVMEYLKEADAAFCNLETAVSDQGSTIDKRYTFRSPPAAADALAKAGFDIVSLGNNHVLDFGPDALADTLRRLDSAGLRQVGLATSDQPQQPVVLALKGLRVGFLAYVDPTSSYATAKEYEAYNPKPARATEERCAADIRALRSQCDIVVVSMHWGTEYQPLPDERQRTFGRFLIDAGAHVIAGHHPHVQQEPEWYNGGVIIHSMGNFVFDQWSRPATRLSRLYRVYLSKSGPAGLEYLPLDKEKDTWLLVPMEDQFKEVPAPVVPQGMPVRAGLPVPRR